MAKNWGEMRPLLGDQTVSVRRGSNVVELRLDRGNLGIRVTGSPLRIEFEAQPALRRPTVVWWLHGYDPELFTARDWINISPEDDRSKRLYVVHEGYHPKNLGELMELATQVLKGEKRLVIQDKIPQSPSHPVMG